MTFVYTDGSTIAQSPRSLLVGPTWPHVISLSFEFLDFFSNDIGVIISIDIVIILIIIKIVIEMIDNKESHQKLRKKLDR